MSLFKRLRVFVFLLAFLILSKETIFSQTFYNSEFVDVNRIKAYVDVHGDFWHFWNGNHFQPGCEYPKGTGKHLALAAGLWMAGFDSSQNLRAAATAYRQWGQEYWPGPLMEDSISLLESEKWAKIWKMDKTEIQNFLTHSTHTLSNIPINILEWPAKGNPFAKGNNGSSLTIPDNMAPFVDVNGDGLYNPLHGDYPKIKGEQMLWFIFNDYGPIPHNEITFAKPAGIQVKGVVYGYNSIPALENILYYDFELENKKQTLDSFVLGFFADMDLGFGGDDYIGFDSSRNLAYIYNGRQTDGNGNPSEYGDSIPMAGIRFLQFPGNDCNSHQSLGSFIRIDNSTSPTGFPVSSTEVYHYLNHRWKDGTPLKAPSQDPSGAVYKNGYGGSGTPISYIYDNRPYGSGIWQECLIQNIPSDRKFLMALKPISFQKGAKQKLSFALIATEREKNNGCPSVNFSSIKTLSDSALFYFCQTLTGIENHFAKDEITLFPNPVTDYLIIANAKEQWVTEVYDVLGKKMDLLQMNRTNSIQIITKELTSGMYFLVIKSDSGTINKKFVKLQ